MGLYLSPGDLAGETSLRQLVMPAERTGELVDSRMMQAGDLVDRKMTQAVGAGDLVDRKMMQAEGAGDLVDREAETGRS